VTFGSLKVVGNVTIPLSAYNFLFTFHRNYAHYVVPFSRYLEQFLESRIFSIPRVYLTLMLGMTSLRFQKSFGVKKLEFL